MIGELRSIFLAVKGAVELEPKIEGVLAEMGAQLERSQDNFMITRETLAAWYDVMASAKECADNVITGAELSHKTSFELSTYLHRLKKENEEPQ